jgi:hypothetical protein
MPETFARQSLIRNTDGTLEMWFCYRSRTQEKYRIAYAFSDNGERWDLRLDDAGIDVSPISSAWDSDMIEYPFVFDHAYHTIPYHTIPYHTILRCMLYCGNGYGKTGFGLAIQEK